jgi:LuxR family maltose regulon positive regulatory protein
MYRPATLDAMAGLALAYQALGRSEAADATANDLLAFAGETGDIDALTLAHSARARLALAQGDLDAAARWARSVEVDAVTPALLFWLDNPVITRARILVAAGSEEEVRQASELLATLCTATEALHNDCQRIEILVLQSVALDRLGQAGRALAVLKQVVGMAERGGWIQPFVEAGPAMADLLQRLTERIGRGTHADRLIAALSGAGSRACEAPASAAARSDTALLAESLTARELDILECLTQRLRNKEIARQLSISEETVKFHLKNLYQKLGVGSRRQAAVRAEELRPFRRSAPSQ